MKQSIVMVLMAGVALAGCSKVENGTPDQPAGRAETRSDDFTPSVAADQSAGPGINVTAAVGVAFDYRYQFRLAANRIAQVQETHAQACEALGIARCRITGMHFRVGRDANDITGSLDFKLDPSLARKFGTKGIEAIVAAGGKLGSADITGTDAGAAIKDIDHESARLRDNLTEIEAQLAKLPPKARDREALQTQAQRIRDQLSSNAANRDDQADSLATTPVSFSYQSAQGWLGIDSAAPFYSAIAWGRDSFTAAVLVAITLIGVALPWALLIGLLALLYRRFGRRIIGWMAPPAPAAG